jgi:hypothetical protein
MGTTWHKFWVHGLEAHVQNEPHPIATEAELRPGYTYPNPRRNSQGTRVRQNVGRNWFHFAIPTPIAMEPSTHHEYHLEVKAVLLRGRGNNCSIKAVHVWSGGAGGGKKICEYDVPRPRLLDGEFDEEYDVLPYYHWKEPLAIDILVEFEEDGDITFGGAGVWFEAEVPAWVYAYPDAPCHPGGR